MTEDRRLPASFVYNEEMYILGGYNDASGWRDSVEYKPKGQDSFVALPDWKMDVAAYSQCAVAYDDKIYVMGKIIENNLILLFNMDLIYRLLPPTRLLYHFHLFI